MSLTDIEKLIVLPGGTIPVGGATPGDVAALMLDIAAAGDRALVLDPDRGETREAWSTDPDGNPDDRPAITQGTVAVSAALGGVLRIAGADVPDAGYLDVVQRQAHSTLAGAVWRITARLARAVDPTDPAGHSVQVSVWPATAAKASIGRIIAATVTPTVAGGPLTVTFTMSSDAGRDVTLPSDARYFSLGFRVFGQDALHRVDLADIELLNISDLVATSADVAALDARVDTLEDEVVNLDARVDAETAARIAADDDLQAQVDALELAAALGFPLFPNTAAGIAGVADGATFAVATDGVLSLYQRVMASAVLLTVLASTAHVVSALEAEGYVARASEPLHDDFKVRIGATWYSPDWLVMIIAGQSNGLGNDNSTNGDKTTNPNVYAYNATAGTMGVATLGALPFNTDASAPNNAAFHAAARVSAELRRPVLILVAAVPGSGIGTWLPSVPGTNWTAMESQIADAFADLAAPLWGKETIDYLLWLQGENEYDLTPLYTLSTDRYPDLLSGAFAASWAAPDMMFIAGELARQSVGATAFRANEEYAKVAASGRFARFFLASSADLVLTGMDVGQQVHYSGASLQTMGERMADIAVDKSVGIRSAEVFTAADAVDALVRDEVHHTLLCEMLFSASDTFNQAVTIPGARAGVTTVFELDGVFTEVTPESPATAAVFTVTSSSPTHLRIWYPTAQMRDEAPGVSLSKAAGEGTLRAIRFGPLASISTVFIAGHPILQHQVVPRDLPRGLTSLRMNSCPKVRFDQFVAADLPEGLTQLEFGGTTGALMSEEVRAAITAENAARGGTITSMTLADSGGIEPNATFASLTTFTTAITDGFTTLEGALVRCATGSAATGNLGRVCDFVKDSTALAIANVQPAGWRFANPSHVFTFLGFGAKGDGTTDDGAAINAALAFYKTAVEAVSNQTGSLSIDGLGLKYRSTISLNFTGVSAFGANVRNFTILSEATGKTAFDMIGTRGVTLTEVTVEGHVTNTPRVGIMQARAASGGQEGFCDHVIFNACNTRGYFSLAGIYAYGAESNTHLSCEWWNSAPGGHSAILVGRDIYPVTSDYLTAITGETSFINNRYSRCDFRHLPASGNTTLTAATATNPLTVTVASAAQFEIGDTVVFGEQVGMPELYNLKATITGKVGNVLTFGAVNASAWSAYTSGGFMLRSQTVSSLLLGRMSGHTFDDCYFVNYGTDAIEVDMLPTITMEGLHFNNALFEGYGSRSNMRFMVGTSSRGLRDFRLSTYATRVRDSVFSTDSSGAGSVQILKATAIVSSVVAPALPKIFDTEAEYVLYGADIVAYAAAAIIPASFSALLGKILTVGDGVTRYYGFYGVGDQRRAPRTGTQINTLYEDGTGTTSAFLRYDSSADAFSWSLDGTTTNYNMQASGFYPATDNTIQSGLINRRWSGVYGNQFRPGIAATPPIWTSGTGSPEGVVTAGVGSLFTRSDGGAGTTFYVKESGTGNTGWVPK